MNQGQSSFTNSMNYLPTFTPYPKLRPVKTECSTSDELSQALQLLSPYHIQENLSKILKFLKSDGKELDFSAVTSKTATILVQLAKDYNNFKHKSFHSTTLQTGIEIFNILEENRTKYKLVHSYESGKSSNKMLSPKSRAFNKEKLPESINNAEIQVSSSFKIKWLNVTIRFLRDETKTEMEYEEMSIQESKFVQNIIQPYQNNGVGCGSQSLYSGLWGCLKECTTKNNLSIAFKDTGNPMTTIVTLLKFPKTPISEVKTPAVKPPPTNIATGHLEKEKTAIPKVEHKNGTSGFLKNIMQAILSFVDDDLRATFSIGDLTDEQSQVVLRICNRARNNDSFPSDCQELARKLKASLKNLKDRHLILNINNDKQIVRNKNEIVKTVKFTKSPKETQGKPLNTQSSNIIINKATDVLSKIPSRFENAGTKMTISNSTQGTNMTTSPLTQGTKMNTNNSTQGNKIPTITLTPRTDTTARSLTQGIKMITGTPTQGTNVTSGSSTQGTKVSTSSSNLGIKLTTSSSSLGTKLTTSSSTQGTKTAVGNSIQETKSKTVSSTEGTKANANLANLPKNKKKMIEDMSVPVESDIGIRMMLLMGWEGGALGARGEGITEPIIPALDVAKRAGLGHVIEPKPITLNKSTDLKRAFNQHMLDLVKSDLSVKEIVLNGEIKKKDNKYIRLVIDSLNDRKALTNSYSTELQNGVLSILKQLTDKPEIALQCCIMKKGNRPSPTTKLTLTKTSSRLVDRNLNNQPLPNTSHKELITNDLIISISMSTGTSRLVFGRHDDDVAKIASFRITFLVKSLEFLKANIQAKHFKFECALSLVKQNFLNDMVDHLNGGRQMKVGSDVENDVISAIKDRLRFKPFCLKLQIHYDLLGYVLEKCPKGVQIQVPQHFPNKVLINKQNKPKNPPQITAQQLSKTFANRTITNRAIESDDDDVILIENDIPVLIVSDDENIDSASTELSSKSINKNGVDKGKPINVDNMQIVIDGVRSLGNNCTSKDNNNNSQKPNGGLLLKVQNGITQANNQGVTQRTNDKGVREKSNGAIEASRNMNEIEMVANSKIIAYRGLGVVNYKREISAQSNVTNTGHENKKEIITRLSNENTNKSTESSVLHMKDKNNNKTDHNHKNADIDLNVEKETEIDLSTLEMNEDDLLDDTSYDIYIDDHRLSNKSDKTAVKNIEDCKEDALMIDFNDDFSLEEELVIKDGDDTSSSKRSRTEFEEVNTKASKRTKLDKLRHIRIVPENYPGEKIDYSKAEAIQGLICKNIDGVNSVLPRLKCLGIQNGGLVYFCYTEISYYWLVNVLDFANSKLRLKIVDFEADSNDSNHVLALKIRSFVRESCDVTFKRIERYNKCLSTDNWIVLEETRKNDVMIIKIEVDSASYDYIVRENFTLHAGIDEAMFSIIF